MVARTRLNTSMRDQLIAFSKKVVDPRKEKKALDAAYAKAKPLAIKAIAAKYPHKDMAVLSKYGLSEKEESVRISCGSIVVEFKFREGDEATTPRRYGNEIFMGDEATGVAIDEWASAYKAFNEERKRRLEAYFALIHGSTYLDQVTAAWPEADGIVQPNKLPIALNPEQIALIKGDVRERKLAA